MPRFLFYLFLFVHKVYPAKIYSAFITHSSLFRSSCVKLSGATPQRRQAASNVLRSIFVKPVCSNSAATALICSLRIPLYPQSL